MLWFKKLLKKVLPKSVVDWLRSSREKGRFYTWRIVWFIRQKLLPHRYVTDPYLACEIYFINPAMVSYTTIAEFNYFRDHNKVVGGDWDLPLRGFEEDLFFESYKELVRGNKQWSDTPYYRHHLEDILNGHSRRHSHLVALRTGRNRRYKKAHPYQISEYIDHCCCKPIAGILF